MADQPPLKDFIVPVKRPGRKPDELPIKAPNNSAAEALAERIAKYRGWKSAEIGKAQEKK
jgi:hypothetical protein